MKRTNLVLQTVVETPEFIKQAKESMSDKMRNDFIDYIAKNPLEGTIIQSTGGARVIYYFHDEDIPIFLFTAFKKNQRENITPVEKAALKKIIKLIVKAYKEEA